MTERTIHYHPIAGLRYPDVSRRPASPSRIPYEDTVHTIEARIQAAADWSEKLTGEINRPLLQDILGEIACRHRDDINALEHGQPGRDYAARYATCQESGDMATWEMIRADAIAAQQLLEAYPNDPAAVELQDDLRELEKSYQGYADVYGDVWRAWPVPEQVADKEYYYSYYDTDPSLPHMSGLRNGRAPSEAVQSGMSGRIADFLMAQPGVWVTGEGLAALYPSEVPNPEQRAKAMMYGYTRGLIQQILEEAEYRYETKMRRDNRTGEEARVHRAVLAGV